MNGVNDRQTGRTTQQMLAAPAHAMFVWCNDYIEYPRRLAHTLGRDDLEVVTFNAFATGRCWFGRKLTGFVIDHAAELTKTQWEVAKYIIRENVK